MENRKLELYEIAGYLPHGLKFKYFDDEWERNRICWIASMTYDENEEICFTDGEVEFYEKLYKLEPLLRPPSDLYKPIIHNGKEIVPIVEIGIMVDDIDANLWKLGEYAGKPCAKKRTSFLIFDKLGRFQYSGYNVNSIKLFDYLHELKIDYRGLIDAGLAIDCYALEFNPYK